MPLAPGAAVIDLRDQLAAPPKLSALTPENVPTPPVAAQAPELSPFDTDMPLPPSTSGNTSRPEMTSGIKGLHNRAPVEISRIKLRRGLGRRAPGRHRRKYNMGNIGENGSDTPVE